jgi:hypothetical protein
MQLAGDELVDDVAILFEGLAATPGFIQNALSTRSQDVSTGLLADPSGDDGRVVAGLTEDDDAEGVCRTQPVERRGDSFAVSRGIDGLMAEVDRRPVALPDQWIEGEVQVGAGADHLGARRELGPELSGEVAGVAV